MCEIYDLWNICFNESRRIFIKCICFLYFVSVLIAMGLNFTLFSVFSFFVLGINGDFESQNNLRNKGS